MLWDDWGGWYDNVPPPQPDFGGLGFRVPCSSSRRTRKARYVSHTQYEFGSILKFVEETFGLRPRTGVAAYTDRAQQHRRQLRLHAKAAQVHANIGSRYPAAHFIKEPPSHDPVDTE